MVLVFLLLLLLLCVCVCVGGGGSFLAGGGGGGGRGRKEAGERIFLYDIMNDQQLTLSGKYKFDCKCCDS